MVRYPLIWQTTRMQINRLRLLGFKSFVDPTELVIEPGLTGVVGPNGCGKSNLLEALRWVMGETSHKSMRAVAMDDVIFAGTQTRPSRNVAEVTLFLDNKARIAPAEFNGHDVIEITRRIEREAGSAYRVNGADVRARDVKILFEDAATGARSPALVRQGQISEIVNAKPEQRRRILEDAAGVAGLHSRRHDAELRLKAADANLARVADIMGSYTSQIDSLKRQARQARRYRELSIEIRKAEAVALHVAWADARSLFDSARAALANALERLGSAVGTESKAVLREAALAEALPPLRDEEATRAAILARLKVEQDNFVREAERAGARQRELTARVTQLDADVVREAALTEEAAETLARLDADLMDLTEADDGAEDTEARARDVLETAKAAETAATARLAEITRRDVEQQARAKALMASLAERREQATRVRRQLEVLDDQLREIGARAPEETEKLAGLMDIAAELEETIEAAEARVADAEHRFTIAKSDADRRRTAAQHANLDLRGIETEQATLARLLRPRSGDGFTPALDLITVERGYETALGAALGDDLDAPIETDDGSAVATGGPLLRWRVIERHADDHPLPREAEPLAAWVEGPAALTRGLQQVGLVAAADGARLQPTLKPGQRLVSRAGDVWRWDGFIAAADAPTAAAERLAQKNRLVEIEQRCAELKAISVAATAADLAASQASTAAESDGRTARQSVKDAQGRLAKNREQLVHVERATRESESRLAAVAEARHHAAEALTAAQQRVTETELLLDAAEETEHLDEEIAVLERALTEARAASVRAISEAAGLDRERRLRTDRLSSLRGEHQRWTTRSAAASRQIETLRARAAEAREELATHAGLPAEIEAQRQRLGDATIKAERERAAAADRLESTDTELREARAALRTAQAVVANERESRAGLEARLDGARGREADAARKIRETLDCAPDACLAHADIAPGAALPSIEEIERQLGRLKTDLDRLGGVNLAAEQELETINAQLSALDTERIDVEAAIAKLRGAIGQLNGEGKKRIDDAFKAVDAHFRELFTTLFNGGEARLEMIDSDDPLEGGLEIIAKPPGKKPATLSLLSGGEQTLTALSLIFAVFLTNPSPICVLDEVDAPLDDANVDRFSTMMEKMAAETDTRFLVITHHPQTMARMSRLFGVTMSERGVSQLVSVDLATAERIIEDETPQRAAE